FHINGTVEGYAAINLQVNDGRLTAVVRPALERVHISSISGNGLFSIASRFKDLITQTLNRYRDNINGQIRPVEVAVANIKVEPYSLNNIFDQSQPAKLSELALQAASVLLSGQGVYVLVSFSYDGKPTSPSPTEPPTDDYLTFAKTFARKAQ